VIHSLIDHYKADIITNSQKIIAIESVESSPTIEYPFGRAVAEGLEFLLALGRGLGFTTKNLDNYVGYIEAGSGREIFGVLGHVDVVPATGSGWNFDPFGGVIHDGKLYGRGALDDKCALVASLYAMKIALESGHRPQKRIRLIIGTNEETGWECIRYYLKKEEEPGFAVSPDADFPVINGEKGALTFKVTKKFAKNNEVLFLEGGLSANVVPAECTASIRKAGRSYTIKTSGKAAHAATPELGINAVSKMFENLNTARFEHDEVVAFIKLYNQVLGFDLNGVKMGLNARDDVSGSPTVNVGRVLINRKQIEMLINIRRPFCLDKDYLVNHIKALYTDKGFEVSVERDFREIYHSAESCQVQKLLAIYREVTGDSISKPQVIGGATYARALKNAVAFGPLFPGRIDTAHQVDEHISISDLIALTEIYVKAIIAFS
jgi:succinyl-diaminopimelate desuccinylase